jgi:hypothetical protein
VSPEEKARFQWLWDRQTQGYRGPYGSWAQRWIPGVCKHEDVRCIHGDEIVARNFRRRLCLVCWRALEGDLPETCWFTLTSHSRS